MIPARLDSTRLPGKLMMDLNGIPVILSTLLNTLKTNLFDDVYVVTDSNEIYSFLIKHHKNILLSKENHESGSDRIAEFAKDMQVDVIVNVQGDEPLIDKNSLEKLINTFKLDNENKIDLVSLMKVISNKEEVENPNNVKVVIDSNNFAMYFSRNPIPYDKDLDIKVKYYKHIGVYGFRKKSLVDFYNSKPSKLELIEKLEQLRYLENGKKIKMVITDFDGIGIDTMEDLIKARNLLK
ncbi:3-deoxy-manno-octulosonate cytidylyltransferase [Flavobacteriaceae bacterium]|jgi:3-deoxy-manno-octulosonate cytidylyltransferase (CMP-KDO synthetase)|nr:3-deoxy-manno-octulosonate cytidylyltransferase [Flavobacteriaceae bacterium]MDB4601392.1 3-deoxy-manno-octulosonate cytidylyltransferase [Flavobacteriaceae bacterium]MDC0355231.1 3-deoxy-manno-octulosonate cytidylyltransferase [Flavobacteriaceae bacterium]MDC0472093.1 3-deoxy-manno-octulosonate cytidylyltransferase [Flavobacteriaceae bacterium]MDC0553914.1 3-deoxy-manno-octulosonate cytidylyltransferase [Flavobacteriaceae bacterium]|tara:strand:- start:690 stop:1403 length:714 start_codon:yes stop_codon:yes gene_type:complete